MDALHQCLAAKSFFLNRVQPKQILFKKEAMLLCNNTPLEKSNYCDIASRNTNKFNDRESNITE